VTIPNYLWKVIEVEHDEAAKLTWVDYSRRGIVLLPFSLMLTIDAIRVADRLRIINYMHAIVSPMSSPMRSILIVCWLMTIARSVVHDSELSTQLRFRAFTTSNGQLVDRLIRIHVLKNISRRQIENTATLTTGGMRRR
jgi:hypothetical protein